LIEKYNDLLLVLLHYQVCFGATSAFELNGDLLEATIMEQKATGRIVKAFYLVNPNNPLGEVYSPQLVLQLIEVCHRSGLISLNFLILGPHIYDTETCKIWRLSQTRINSCFNTH
jgi:aspartate/methionine/tyrosine aminotransferase